MCRAYEALIITVLVAFVGFGSPIYAQSRNEGIRLFKEGDDLYVHAKSTQDMKEAVSKFNQALGIFEKEPYEKGVAAAANNLSMIYRRWGQYKDALQYLEKSLSACRKLHDPKIEAEALGNMSVVYGELGSTEKALGLGQQALSIYRRINDPLGQAQAQQGLGYLHYYRGDYAKAVPAYEAALALYERVDDLAGQGQALNNIGDVRCRMGLYPDALIALERAQVLLKKARSPKDEGATLANIGEVYENLGLFKEAKDNYEKALHEYREVKDARAEIEILKCLGNVCKQSGDVDGAHKHYERSLSLCEKIGFPSKESRDLIGNLWLDRGDLARAQRYLIQGENNASMGRLYLLKAQYAKAKEYYEKAVDAAERTRNAQDLFAGYTGLGVISEALGDFETAAKYFKKAVSATEEARSGLKNRHQRENFFRVKVGGFLRITPYKGLARVLMKMKQHESSLRQSEYTKARVYAEELSTRIGNSCLGVPAAIVQQDTEISDRMATLKLKRQQAYENQRKEVLETIEPQIRKVVEQLKSHILELHKKYPVFAASKYPEPMDLERTALRDDEWVLAYDVTDSGVLVFLTQGKRLVRATLKETPRNKLEDLVRKFRAPTESPKLESFDFRSGNELANLLLGGMLNSIPKGAHVSIVPDECLEILPFEMLVLSGAGEIKIDRTQDDKHPGKSAVRAYVTGCEFFGDRNSISYYQSVTALTLIRNQGRRERGSRILVMADPIFPGDKRLTTKPEPKVHQSTRTMSLGLMRAYESRGCEDRFKPLPATRELAESLRSLFGTRSDIFTGPDADKENLLTNIAPELMRYGSVVFATHGHFGEPICGISEPLLALTLHPPGRDGFLKRSDVLGLKMNADIVALTACQTGLGQSVSGEGTMSMGRAFQQSGASSVLMSLWEVDARASVRLAESFFKHRKEDKSKLESLHLARQEIRSAGFDHPFFWAAFILVGEVD